MPQVRTPRLTLDEVRSLGRAAEQLQAVANVLSGSQWQGAAPVFVLVKQAYEAIAPIYIRAEFSLPEKRLAPQAAASSSGASELAQESDPSQASETSPGGQ